MKRSRRPDLLLPACALAGALLLSRAEAEPVLTGIVYTEGSPTYSLYAGNGQSLSGGGDYSRALRAGMALPAAVRIDTDASSRVEISPASPIRYLIEHDSHAVNESFSLFPGGPSGGSTLDHRLRLVSGTLVGDVSGPLRGIVAKIVTPRGTATSTNGHFLITVRADGTTKFAVRAGALAVDSPGDSPRSVGAGQVLILLSDAGKQALSKLNAEAATVGGSATVEPRPLFNGVALSGASMGALSADAEATRIMNLPFPDPNADLFANPPSIPMLTLLPGEVPPGNPADFVMNQPVFAPNGPNPANTPTNPPNPPVSPVTP